MNQQWLASNVGGDNAYYNLFQAEIEPDEH